MLTYFELKNEESLNCIIILQFVLFRNIKIITIYTYLIFYKEVIFIITLLYHIEINYIF
jgi:hypothetical protein